MRNFMYFTEYNWILYRSLLDLLLAETNRQKRNKCRLCGHSLQQLIRFKAENDIVVYLLCAK